MLSIFQDVRYAVRTLLRQPGFSLIVVLTLGVGLGANAAVFGMVDALILRPMPLPDLDRLVEVFETVIAKGEDRGAVAPANFLDWRRDARVFDRLVAIDGYNDLSLSVDPAADSAAGQQPERVVGAMVSSAFFETLGVQPVVGRGFRAEEETRGRHHVVVVSHRLWQRRWAGDLALVGRTILLDSQAYTVIGIAPPGFNYPSANELWMPLGWDAATAAQRTRRYCTVIGRLAPGVTAERAATEMSALAARLAREHPVDNAGYDARVMPLSRAMLDLGTPTVLAIWQLAVALVLVIAGANMANLLLVRGASRQRELALRLAVGASRWRIVRQLIVESVVLSVGGVALAVPFAWAGLHLIRVNMPPEIERFILGWQELDMDMRLLAATAALAVVAGMIFGVVPALRASRPDLAIALKEGGRGGTAGRGRALHAFVVAQVALALALLVASGLSVRGSTRLLTDDYGYDPAHVMSFSLTLPEKTYPEDAARLRFYDRLVERVRATSGVERVAVANIAPFSGNNARRPIEIEGRAIANPSERPNADFRSVTAEYFQTVRGSVLQGRGFGPEDRPSAPRVAIVNELMASRLWPGETVIGRRFRPMNLPDQPWITVVGVARNIKHDWFFGYQPTYYVPLAQNVVNYATLLVRTGGSETAIVPAVRQLAREIDPDLPLFDVHSLEQWRWLRTIGMQYVAALMAAFAGIGLFLSAIGIYGVMAYSVTQRTRELGVRIALGATGAQVMKATLGEALTLTAIGIVVGLVAAFGLAQVMVATLFGVIELDTITFVWVAAVLALVAVVAGGVPARRAMRVDPIVALRAE